MHDRSATPPFTQLLRCKWSRIAKALGMLAIRSDGPEKHYPPIDLAHLREPARRGVVNGPSQSALVRRHLRRALVVGWVGYATGLFAACTLGLSVFALASGLLWVGTIGLAATFVLGATVVGDLLFCAAEARDPRDQQYLRRARHTSYLRTIPRA